MVIKRYDQERTNLYVLNTLEVFVDYFIHANKCSYGHQYKQ